MHIIDHFSRILREYLKLHPRVMKLFTRKKLYQSNERRPDDEEEIHQKFLCVKSARKKARGRRRRTSTIFVKEKVFGSNDSFISFRVGNFLVRAY